MLIFDPEPLYTTQIMTRPFIPVPRSAPWHLLLVTALLFVSVQDLRHDHADGLDAPACYTCHFAIELGVLPYGGAPAARPGVAARPSVPQAMGARAAASSPYDARGPPLLN